MAQIPAHKRAEPSGLLRKLPSQPIPQNIALQQLATPFRPIHSHQIAGTGFERPQETFEETHIAVPRGAKSGAVGAQTDLAALARALLELPPEDRRRLLKIIEQGGKTP